MSGGFFRGTSADQDTRFSNKQAKLLKTQKFAPELEHLVDVSKVKMDVVKPWIATRVTEILGFEDEVLINFIYGLLDKKVVNGKEVQIQITGFMEKNTGKFMKELWNLLLSAQTNASGVPQQFLDAKEEEIRKKKVETDRITQEIQRKKDLDHEKQKKMDDEAAISKALNNASRPAKKHSGTQSEDDEGSGERNGVRRKNRSSRSPHSAERSPSPDRVPRARSISKSFSNSRSHSNDRHKSRSISRSPQSRRRSISPARRYRSPRKRTLSPHRKYSPRRQRSPIRRKSPYSRRRASPYSRRRSLSPGSGSASPVLRRSFSPRRRRPPTPVRRRSPSPVRRHRSPVRRRRSRSPMGRRPSPSPMRRRSPPPMRRRSPSRRGSPSLRRRSPTNRRRSPSPSRYLSPPRRSSPSPLRRSPPPRLRRRSPFHPPRQTYRSGSPFRSRSPTERKRRSLSRDDDIQTNGMGSRRYRDDYVSERTHRRKSPVHIPEREEGRHSGQGHKGLDPVTRQPPISLRSPQRDSGDGTDAHRKMPVSRDISPSHSGSSLQMGKSSPSEDRSLSEGPPKRNTRERVTHSDSASPVRNTRERVSRASASPMRNTRAQVTHVDSASPMRNTRERVTHADSASPVRNTRERVSRASASPTRNTRARVNHADIASPMRNTRERVTRADSASPMRNTREIVTRADSASSLRQRHSIREEQTPKSRVDGGQRTESPQRRSKHSGEAGHRTDDIEMRTRDRDHKSVKTSSRTERSLSPTKSPYTTEAVERNPRRVDKSFSDITHDEQLSAKQRVSSSPKRLQASYSREDHKVDPVRSIQVDSTHRADTLKSDSEDEKNKSNNIETRKHKRHHRHHTDSDDDSSYESHKDERREAKRRKKEEKKLRKEEKRKRREEKRRRKEERHASKLKAKTMDISSPPSDIDRKRSDADSDDHVAAKMDFHPSDTEEMEAEQRQLEIVLREKALESLRAKKAINP